MKKIIYWQTECFCTGTEPDLKHTGKTFCTGKPIKKFICQYIKTTDYTGKLCVFYTGTEQYLNHTGKTEYTGMAVRWGRSSWTGAQSPQPLPCFYPGPMGDPVCQGRHLCWFVWAAVTAPTCDLHDAPKLTETLLNNTTSMHHWAGATVPCGTLQLAPREGARNLASVSQRGGWSDLLPGLHSVCYI